MNNNDLYRPDWVPPHCPNRNCNFHNPLQEGWRWKRDGYYKRKAFPRRIRRFKCKACGVTFSSQTFSTTYWLKRPDILLQLPTKVTSGACNSQIAHDLGVSPATIDRQIYRLGRHAILFHSRMMRDCPPSRTSPSTASSRSSTASTTVPLPRRRPPALLLLHPLHRQRGPTIRHHDRQAEATTGRPGRIRGRPDPQAVRKDMQELLEYVTEGTNEMTLHSDDHKAYPRAIRNLRCQIRHLVTSSKDIRNRINKLFEINLLDLLIRHWEAEHKRETIAYAKRRNCAAYKLAIFLVLRNYVKTRRVRKSHRTPAQLQGVSAEVDGGRGARQAVVRRSGGVGGAMAPVLLAGGGDAGAEDQPAA
ncbi:MAG: hypothetical protein R3D98_05905 [Candidatus Krumholzibacteriia bacterium]